MSRAYLEVFAVRGVESQLAIIVGAAHELVGMHTTVVHPTVRALPQRKHNDISYMEGCLLING